MIRIFTDGACSGNPGPGGWAFVVNSETKSKTYSGGESNTTNNRMELMPVINALEYMLKHKIKKAEIISDSAYVINALEKGWLEKWSSNGWRTTKGDDVKNADLWKQLLDMLKGLKTNNFEIKFTKVKGHAGNTFNEIADQAARAQCNNYK